MQATKYYTAAETTKMLKDELKKHFPTAKFSVARRPSGNSVNVSYTDGPAFTKVNAIAKKYEGASFDGTIDLESGIDQTRVVDGAITKVHYQVTYVFVNRHISDEFRARITAEFQSKFHIDFDPETGNDRYDNGWKWTEYYKLERNLEVA